MTLKGIYCKSKIAATVKVGTYSFGMVTYRISGDNKKHKNMLKNADLLNVLAARVF